MLVDFDACRIESRFGECDDHPAICAAHIQTAPRIEASLADDQIPCLTAPDYSREGKVDVGAGELLGRVDQVFPFRDDRVRCGLVADQPPDECLVQSKSFTDLALE